MLSITDIRLTLFKNSIDANKNETAALALAEKCFEQMRGGVISNKEYQHLVAKILVDARQPIETAARNTLGYDGKFIVTALNATLYGLKKNHQNSKFIQIDHTAYPTQSAISPNRSGTTHPAKLCVTEKKLYELNNKAFIAYRMHKKMCREYSLETELALALVPRIEFIQLLQPGTTAELYQKHQFANTRKIASGLIELMQFDIDFFEEIAMKLWIEDHDTLVKRTFNLKLEHIYNEVKCNG